MAHVGFLRSVPSRAARIRFQLILATSNVSFCDMVQAGVMVTSVASLTDTDLRALGIATLGQRKKVLVAAATLATADGSDEAPACDSASAQSGGRRGAQIPADDQARGGSGGGGSKGRITDFFQPKGGPRPAAPAFQAPLDGLLAAARPHATIARFFPAAPPPSNGGADGQASSAGRAAAAPARGHNAAGGTGGPLKAVKQDSFGSQTGAECRAAVLCAPAVRCQSCWLMTCSLQNAQP